jgi:hypothetical protein
MQQFAMSTTYNPINLGTYGLYGQTVSLAIRTALWHFLPSLQYEEDALSGHMSHALIGFGLFYGHYNRPNGVGFTFPFTAT